MGEALTIHLVRHGEVFNPEGIIYGRIPGFGLSETGVAQLQASAAALDKLPHPDRLYASPMQRAQESAAILSQALGLEVSTDDRLIETDVSGYQGKTFAALPKPYITEEPVHEGLECAASIRRRIVAWAAALQAEGVQRVAAVSHRDPIAVVVLHWMGRSLEGLAELDLPPGGVYEVHLAEGAAPQVRQVET